MVIPPKSPAVSLLTAHQVQPLRKLLVIYLTTPYLNQVRVATEKTKFQTGRKQMKTGYKKPWHKQQSIWKMVMSMRLVGKCCKSETC